MLNHQLNVLKLIRSEKKSLTDHDSSESSMKASCWTRPAIVRRLGKGCAMRGVENEILNKCTGMKISLKEY